MIDLVDLIALGLILTLCRFIFIFKLKITPVGENIGHFKVDRFDGATIKIGCHDISMKEIHRVIGPAWQNREQPPLLLVN